MNQILVAGNKSGKKNNNNSTIDIKKIVLFFSVAIIIFGVFLIINGVIGLNKKDDGKVNSPMSSAPSPTVTPSTQTPIQEDEEPPVIELLVSGETIKIVVTDETELDYIEYGWSGEDVETVIAEENQTEIEASINIKQGTNTLEVTAVDRAENVQTKTQSFQGKIRPTVKLFVNETGDGVIISAECQDGINKIEYTVNEKWHRLPFAEFEYTQEEWAQIGAILEYSSDGKIIKVEYTHKLVEEQNEFYVYVYSLEGLVGNANGHT